MLFIVIFVGGVLVVWGFAELIAHLVQWHYDRKGRKARLDHPDYFMAKEQLLALSSAWCEQYKKIEKLKGQIQTIASEMIYMTKEGCANAEKELEKLRYDLSFEQHRLDQLKESCAIQRAYFQKLGENYEINY